MTTATRMDVPLGDVTLAADRSGAGEPVTVLLHAGVCDRRSYRAMIEQLDTPGAKVAYDRRGFGETPPSAGGFAHVDDLRALVGTVANGPVWLVGSSIGGAVALDLALTSPELVAGLVLFAPAVSGAPEDAELDPDTRRHVRDLEEAFERGDLDEVNRIEVRVWLDGPGEPEGRVGGAARELARAMNAIVLANGDENVGGSGLDTWARVEDIDVPATVAYGSLDLPALGERCEELGRRMPRARLVCLDGVAHLPYLEDPATAAGVVRRATASLGRSGGAG